MVQIDFKTEVEKIEKQKLPQETRVEEWMFLLQKHYKTILSSIMGGVLLLFLVYQLFHRFQGTSRTDYIEANSLFNEWFSAPKADKDSFQKLEKVISRHPELETKFGALIAERCLQLNDKTSAKKHALAAIKRTGSSSYYEQFAKTSLQIADGKTKDALSASKGLKLEMEEDTAFWEKQDSLVRHGSLLYAFNLLRIAFLEKEAGTPITEMKAWEDFEKHLGSVNAGFMVKTDHPEAYQMLAQSFSDQNISLLDYIQHRKQVLSSILESPKSS